MTIAILQQQRRDVLARIAPKPRDEREKHADVYDEAQATRDEFIDDTLTDRDVRLLAQIDYALDKVRTGHYGICEECGEEINAKRLTAIPWARLCRSCAEEEEVSQRNGDGGCEE
jgi:DnaK suppressor protein